MRNSHPECALPEKKASGRACLFFSFLDVDAQAAHGLGKIFQRICVGKAEKTFRLRTEVDAGSDTDAGFFQNVKGQREGISTQMPRVDQRVERALLVLREC